MYFVQPFTAQFDMVGFMMDMQGYSLNPLTAGVAYIRVFIFISTLRTTF